MVQESPVHVAWYREPGGIRKAHISGAVGTDAVTEALYKCGANPAQIEAFQVVLDNFWTVELDLLTKGGIITTKGKIIATDITTASISTYLQKKIANEDGIDIVPDRLLPSYGYDPNEFEISGTAARALFIGTDVASRFSYREPFGYPSVSTLISFKPDDIVSKYWNLKPWWEQWARPDKKLPKLHGALVRYFNNLRESQNLPKLISADAAVKQLFVDAIDIYNKG